MKKLMIVAAIAAMTSGVYADACDDVDYSEINGDCLVYDVKFSLKTLAPKKLTCKTCDKCSDDDVVYYLADTTRTLKGYLWFCYDDCWDVDDEPYVALWDTKAKSAIIPLYYTIDTTSGAKKKVAQPVTTQFEFLGRYGKKGDKVAALWNVESEYAEIAAAGVKGSVIKDKEEGTVKLKSISGNAVAYIALQTIEVAKKCADPEEFTAKIAALCDCWETWCDDGDEADIAPASGTWSLKYNKSLSKGAKSMLLVVPSYAQELEA